VSRNTVVTRSESAAIAECIVNTLSSAMFIIDDTFHIVTANASFYRIFSVQPVTTAGCLLFDICGRQWDTPELRSILTSILESGTAARKYSLPFSFDSHTVNQLRLNICLLEQMPGKPPLILVYLYDITEKKVPDTTD
jgi:PAS domain-containing protein